MAQHNIFGKNAEIAAIEFLVSQNYRIVDTNWRHKHLEADIIAYDNNILVFIEVKARKSDFYNFDELVSTKKQQNLMELAENYLQANNLDCEVRFDVCMVFAQNKSFSFELIKKAF